MTARSRWIRVTAMFAVLGFALFRFGDRAGAIQDSEDKVWFGPVGITPGERALVNIFAVGNPNEIGNPDETPWDFVVRVFPAANHVLRRLPLAAGGAWDWPRAAPGYLELITDWVQRHGAAEGGDSADSL